MDFSQLISNISIPNLTELMTAYVIYSSAIFLGRQMGIKRVILKSQENITDIKKVILPPTLKEDIKLSELNITTRKKEVEKFVNTLRVKMPESLLKNMYYNLSYLTVKNDKKIVFKGSAGFYRTYANSIVIGESNSVYHELFHMSSTSVDKRFCGFSQDIENKSIGNGINEGYTELLTRRYFTKKEKKPNKKSKVYDFEVSVCRKLEKIVGKNKMTELYLKANLSGLVDELKKYSTEEEISYFINDTDLVTRYGYRLTMLKIKEVQQAIKRIVNYLIKTHLRFLQTKLDEGSISEKECFNMHKEFIESFEKNTALMHKYKVFDSIDLYKSYEELESEKSMQR